MADRSQCVPVIPGGSCPSCGWTWNSPEYTEPHPVLPYGKPNTEVSGKCANCGATYNLDAVKCAKCGFEPVADEMYDKVLAEKNRFRRTQLLAPLPVRAQPITNTADAKKGDSHERSESAS